MNTPILPTYPEIRKHRDPNTITWGTNITARNGESKISVPLVLRIDGLEPESQEKEIAQIFNKRAMDLQERASQLAKLLPVTTFETTEQ